MWQKVCKRDLSLHKTVFQWSTVRLQRYKRQASLAALHDGVMFGLCVWKLPWTLRALSSFLNILVCTVTPAACWISLLIIWRFLMLFLRNLRCRTSWSLNPCCNEIGGVTRFSVNLQRWSTCSSSRSFQNRPYTSNKLTLAAIIPPHLREQTCY